MDCERLSLQDPFDVSTGVGNWLSQSNPSSTSVVVPNIWASPDAERARSGSAELGLDGAVFGTSGIRFLVFSAADFGLLGRSLFWAGPSAEAVAFLFDPARLALLGYVHSRPLSWQRSHAGQSPLHRSFFFRQLTQARRDIVVDARLDGAVFPTWDRLD